MNILFVSHTAGIGGAETVLLQTIHTVCALTDDNVFIALSNDNSKEFENSIKSMISSNRFKIKRFCFRPMRNTTILLVRNLIYSLLLGLPQFLLYIIRNKIDIVYVNSSVNVIPVIAAILSRRKILWHIHEQSTSLHRWTPLWFNSFYKYAFKRCRLIFVSEISYLSWKNDVKDICIKDYDIIYSKFKEITVSPKLTDPFTYGFIGSFNKNKNILTLVKSFLKLRDDSKLLIAGSGQLNDIPREMIEQSNIVVLGPITKLEEFYSKIDVLILPSFNESWGLVVLEAISANKPTIVTINTGLIELFVNNKECIFFDPFDEEALFQHMRKIQLDSIFRSQIIANAAVKLKSVDINSSYDKRILKCINDFRC